MSLSLRARLLIVTVALVGAGLLSADVATYHRLSGFLVRKVDEQLVAAQPAVAFALEHGVMGPGPGTGPDHGNPSIPIGTYAAFCDDTGRILASQFLNGRSSAPPILPSDLPDSASAGTVATFSSPAADGSADYRVFGRGVAQPPGTIVVAIPLAETRSTLHGLFAAQVLIGLVVLLTAGGLASWLVRIGLRPLDGIGETAGAIAAGDLSKRVEPADDRTEVGRLGLSLNAMLAQIEAAFDERRRSEERVRRFAADASHELRTPLTSIRGYAELFRRGAATRPEDLAKSMTRIEAEAARMGVLVDDLLLLTRLDQGRPLERETVDLARIVTDAVDAARVINPERPFDLEVPPTLPMTGDEGRLRQVVDNLLDNARVHTPAETAVHVALVVEGTEAVLTVTDDGPGLDPKVAARAFERFYRGDPARSRSTGGAGLGLSIVAAIVEAHGGTVRAITDRSGATFEVRLSIADPSAPTY
ncbi:MAG: HAMP domain-containing histidine kinase [Actinomycetota bacterium]|nr:HAMP domain-containing histidine kinase [Actinomycetota bacterium]